MIVFGFRPQRLLHGLRVALIGIQWLTWDRPGKNVSSMGSPLRAELGLQVDFGENYVQELLEKELRRLGFIGRARVNQPFRCLRPQPADPEKSTPRAPKTYSRDNLQTGTTPNPNFKTPTPHNPKPPTVTYPRPYEILHPPSLAAGKGVAHLHFDLLEKLALETPTLNQGKGFRVEGLGKFTKFGECVECRVWELRGTYFHSLGLAYCTLVSVASMFQYCLLFVQQTDASGFTSDSWT